jgi:FkbM family methyltransferase
MRRITLKKIIKWIIPYGIWRILQKIGGADRGGYTLQFRLIDDCSVNFYGQCGEDILLRLFCETSMSYKGFYIDIGAYHPVKFSNTNYFYKNGWNGINIDANPNSIEEFNKERKRDINIESGISDQYGELEYYYFGKTSTMNTFDKNLAEEFTKKYDLKIEEIKKVKVQPINAILDEYISKGQHIDFITIDVEGFEMKILQSLDFSKYSPEYFLLEDLNFASKGFKLMQKSALYRFLKEKGYMAVGTTSLTILFKKLLNEGLTC